MTKRESIVLTGYTGIMLCSDFSDFHEYIEVILNRPVYTHELADETLIEEIKEKSKEEFMQIIANIKE